MKNYCYILITFLLLLSCTNDDSQEEVLLEDVIVENVLFEYTEDPANGTARLRYEFKFTNPNSVAVKGFPGYSYQTLPDENVTFSMIRNDHPCVNLEPGESCTIMRDIIDTIDLSSIDDIVLIDLKYTISE
ncbi:hypothetical protein BST97_09190 [Nonlabens spongiae]|uniref:Uncharacterized protein n=1 Tax=Nonlabens spongiae TaxID=331648 RepID=A0A1W6MKX8_9FLAO|nr:hypothetical protein [Nonlabens spongiae]ARN78156.1 hypothetical protein BST97_09190 [Nonlabens spongiae]